ncbi:hypothetical protein [Burkholderia sp. SIMBA_062]|uniref:hypothetical protein n=1 Tax=Burkholderia sp. SIMBA_062 TaxID=3085803 RepID=UPI0039782940
MHDSYNDFCYRQRESCEALDRCSGRPGVHAHGRERRRAANANRIKAMRWMPMRCAMQDERMTLRACRPLRAVRDIDMRKTSLERSEADGYMPSLFSTD